jgi:hypothetical protein
VAEFILLMHAGDASTEADWGANLDSLGAMGVLRGGSAIGDGACFSKAGKAPEITAHLSGYIKVEAQSLEAARALLAGNPAYEAGGVVEIRELPITG